MMINPPKHKHAGDGWITNPGFMLWLIVLLSAFVIWYF